MDRRRFIRNSGVALGTFVSAEAAGTALKQENASARGNDGSPKIGRLVRAGSIGLTPGPSLEQIAGHVDKEGARGTDLIVLPETLRGQDEKRSEERRVGKE